MAGRAFQLHPACMKAQHLLGLTAAGNGTVGVASAVFKAADYSPPLASGTFTLRAVFDPPDGARHSCTQSMFRCSVLCVHASVTPGKVCGARCL